MGNFVSLHNHSVFSPLDGLTTIKDLVSLAKENGHSAVGLTDHGRLSGVVDFYKECKKQGINPVIGMEGYFVPNRTAEIPGKDGKSKVKDRSNLHICVFAKNLEGYQNLCKLSSETYTSGFYYRPRMDWELLEKYHKGLLVTSACIGGVVADPVIKDQTEEALNRAKRFKELFGDDFYLEVMLHPDSPPYKSSYYQTQLKAIHGLKQLGKTLEIPLVLTNDTHYAREKDFKAHEVLLCVQTQSRLDQTNRMSFEVPGFCFLTDDQMIGKLVQSGIDRMDITSWMETSLNIGSKCNVELKWEKRYPEFKTPPDFYSNDDYCRKLLVDSWKQNIEGKVLDRNVYKNRLSYEFEVLQKCGFVDYMLQVRDFVNWAKSQGIRTGPGRGSVCGSLVAYLLGVTTIDPVRFNIPFERFINPFRVSPPDVDLDFQATRRDEVKDYARSKYFVSNIGTFGTFRAKQAVKDAGKVLGLPLEKLEEFAAKIPEDEIDEKEAGKTMLIKDLYQSGRFPDVNQMVDENKDFFDIVFTLEGKIKSEGIHPSGIIIAPEDITNFVPVRVSKGVIVTQFSDKTVEEIGLLKVDLLALKMLDTAEICIQDVKKFEKKEVDLNSLPLDDPKTWKLIQSGKTRGVFQLESETMQRLIGDLQPSDITQLAAMIALFRPGPYRAGMVDKYVQVKRAWEKGGVPVQYLHPKLEPVLKETFGIIVFQEQVMLIAQALAGFSIAEADELRRAIGKMLFTQMKELGKRFIERAAERGVPVEVSQELNRQFETFGVYAFNRGHSIAYAHLSYQTAYLKAHFPLYFFHGLLVAEGDNNDDIREYVAQAEKQGIGFELPHVNVSDKDFSVTNGKIVHGMQKIKYVGDKAAAEIIKVRGDKKFEDLADFLFRVDLRVVNKRVMVALLDEGAFDGLIPDRHKTKYNLDAVAALVRSQKVKKECKKEPVLALLGTEVRHVPSTLLWLLGLMNYGSSEPGSAGQKTQVVGVAENGRLWLNGKPTLFPTGNLSGPVCGTLTRGEGSLQAAITPVEEIFKDPNFRKILRDRVFVELDKCTVCKIGTPQVIGEGQFDGILFVGEAPGADEQRTRRPFVGHSGQLLRGEIRDFGVPVYITNVVRCRPPQNRVPTKKEIVECRRWLEAEIMIVRPKVIVVLGDTALHAVDPTAGMVTTERGIVKEVELCGISCHMVCTWHPAHVSREQEKRDQFVKDLLLAKEVYNGSHPKQQPRPQSADADPGETDPEGGKA